MANPNRRLDLLHRLSRMREVEKQQAALRVAEAEGAHGKLRALAERSVEIAASYRTRADAGDGATLAQQLHFLSGLETIRHQTESERARAHETTQAAMAQLMAAERKRELTTDRLGQERRALERQAFAREAAANPILARNLKSRG